MDEMRRRNRSGFIKRTRSKASFKKMVAIEQPAITRSLYGRENIMKLRRIYDISTTGPAPYTAKPVIGLVEQLQLCNDWASCAGTYQQYNILNVTVKMYVASTQLGSTADSPHLVSVGLGYSSTAGALTNLNQVTDFKQYVLVGTSGRDTTRPIVFKFKPRPSVKPPFLTSSTTETFGYLKGYSDGYGDAAQFAYKLVITYTLAFAAQA